MGLREQDDFETEEETTPDRVYGRHGSRMYSFVLYLKG